MSRNKTNYQGVYSRTSATKRHQGRPDVCFDITYKVNGRKVWEKVGWKSEGYTAALASGIRGQRLQQARHGQLVDTPDITFAKAWQRFDSVHLSTLKHPEVERRRYDKHIKPVLAAHSLDAIQPLDIERLKARLLRTCAPSTATHVLGLIRQVYRKCIQWGLWHGTPPTDAVKMPRKDNERQRWLTVAEAKALMDELKRKSLGKTGGGTGSESTWQIAMISLYTGMRAGEIFKLRGENVDLATGTIRLMDTKSDKPRTAFMTAQIRAIFQGLELAPGQLVFPGRGGAERKKISRAFPRAVERLKLNDGLTDARDMVVFHTLRHTFASHLAMDGVPLYVIGELLGHSTLEMTRRYAHLSPDQKAVAVAHIEKTFNFDQES